MIEGNEVLNKVEIMQEKLPEWLVPTCLSLIVIGVIFGFVFAFLTRENLYILSGFLTGLLLCLPTLLIGDLCTKEVPTGRYRYEVTISDTANFKEIYEKYDVIEQRGDIYVLEEKED